MCFTVEIRKYFWFNLVSKNSRINNIKYTKTIEEESGIQNMTAMKMAVKVSLYVYYLHLIFILHSSKNWKKKISLD